MLCISENWKKVILIGVTGAIVLRTLMVFIGILVNTASLSWILYVFGILLRKQGFKIILESYNEKFQNKNHGNEKEESKLLLFFLNLHRIKRQIHQIYY